MDILVSKSGNTALLSLSQLMYVRKTILLCKCLSLSDECLNVLSHLHASPSLLGGV